MPFGRAIGTWPPTQTIGRAKTGLLQKMLRQVACRCVERGWWVSLLERRDACKESTQR